MEIFLMSLFGKNKEKKAGSKDDSKDFVESSDLFESFLLHSPESSDEFKVVTYTLKDGSVYEVFLKSGVVDNVVGKDTFFSLADRVSYATTRELSDENREALESALTDSTHDQENYANFVQSAPGAARFLKLVYSIVILNTLQNLYNNFGDLESSEERIVTGSLEILHRPVNEVKNAVLSLVKVEAKDLSELQVTSETLGDYSLLVTGTRTEKRSPIEELILDYSEEGRTLSELKKYSTSFPWVEVLAGVKNLLKEDLIGFEDLDDDEELEDESELKTPEDYKDFDFTSLRNDPPLLENLEPGSEVSVLPLEYDEESFDSPVEEPVLDSPVKDDKKKSRFSFLKLPKDETPAEVEEPEAEAPAEEEKAHFSSEYLDDYSSLENSETSESFDELESFESSPTEESEPAVESTEDDSEESDEADDVNLFADNSSPVEKADEVEKSSRIIGDVSKEYNNSKNLETSYEESVEDNILLTDKESEVNVKESVNKENQSYIFDETLANTTPVIFERLIKELGIDPRSQPRHARE
jgi:hypothetical protein